MSTPIILSSQSAPIVSSYPLNYSASFNATGASSLLVAVFYGSAVTFTPIVTYAGGTIPLIGHVEGSQSTLWIFGLPAPATGSNTLSVTAPGQGGSSGLVFISSFSQSDTATPFDGVICGNGSGTSGLLSISPVKSGDLLIAIGASYYAGGTVPSISGSGFTKFLSDTTSTSTFAFAAYSATDSGSGTISETMSSGFNDLPAAFIAICGAGYNVAGLTNTILYGKPTIKFPISITMQGMPSTLALGTVTIFETPVIAAYGTMLVTVTFSPTITGVVTGTLTIASNDPASPVTLTLSGTGTNTVASFRDRFEWIYSAIKNTGPTGNGYFGPTTGANAYTVPYHCVQALICEAPDWGHESASETASFWVKLETWKIGIDGVKTGYSAAWNSIVTNYIPSDTNSPTSTALTGYVKTAPATYQPDLDLPSDYPSYSNTTFTVGKAAYPVGTDSISDGLTATYGGNQIFLMHWMWDTDGVYGFHNGDGTTTQVAINSYQRGRQESCWLTVTQPEWEDFTQGGEGLTSGGITNTGTVSPGVHGFLPIYGQNLPEYPTVVINGTVTATATAYSYGKQWRYTSAPDAEGRAIANAYLANTFATAQGLTTITEDSYAKKMGDYLRYALYDKYFFPIGAGIDISGTGGANAGVGNISDATGCHYLIAWYASWGGEIPATGSPAAWSFRIGASECHFGYNNVDAAYAMATNGNGYSPLTPGSATQWQLSLLRQLEMIRWLQSPEGPISAGVGNSFNGRYENPVDGRQNALFYGMYYTYSPIWHNPPSNRWSGYQAWGLERVAAVYLRTTNRVDSFSMDVHTKCGIILDHFVSWLVANTVVTPTFWSMPVNLYWVSPTPIAGGVTTSTPNSEGNYEYLPSTTWNGTQGSGVLWGTSVPNPNLHCISIDIGQDVGTATCFAQLIIQYVQAKRLAGIGLTTNIPNSTFTILQAFNMAKEVLDCIWYNTKGTIGFSIPEIRNDYTNYNSPIYLPTSPSFVGAMPIKTGVTPLLPNDYVLKNGVSTFISIRPWQRNDPDWPQIDSFINHGGPAPTFNYNRFWAQCEIATAFGMMHYYLGEMVGETPNTGPGTILPSTPTILASNLSVVGHPPDYFSTVGNQIVNSQGVPVRLWSVDWAGFDGYLRPNGLMNAPYKTIHNNWNPSTWTYTGSPVTRVGILDNIRNAGFNCIRLQVNIDMTWAGVTPNQTSSDPGNPYSMQAGVMPGYNPDFIATTTTVGYNTTYIQITCMEMLDKIVSYCGQIGLRIILDMHALAPDEGYNAAACNGRWYTTATPGAADNTTQGMALPRSEAQWIAACVAYATRYVGNSTVIGIDMINEPYNCQWLPSTATGYIANDDLPSALERCATAVLTVNPNLILFVEGIGANSISNTGVITSTGTDTGHGAWWGGNLSHVRTRPLKFEDRAGNVITNKLVFSAHDYTTDTSGETWFSASNYPANLPQFWDDCWGYLFWDGMNSTQYPIWIGEFGSTFANATQTQWLATLTQYLNGYHNLTTTSQLGAGEQGISWNYFSVDPAPTAPPGLFLSDYSAIDPTRMANVTPLMTGTGIPIPITYANIPINITGIRSGNVTVLWATADGTGTAGSDYVAGSGTLTFSLNDCIINIAITIPPTCTIGNTFLINLHSAVGATLLTSSITVTIA
jgi:hypothetical protein